QATRQLHIAIVQLHLTGQQICRANAGGDRVSLRDGSNMEILDGDRDDSCLPLTVFGRSR
ncbi:MAG: hypothetical protein ACPHUF_16525, partial [Gammaproteobacteria bacterium]